jgi:hypothetical protein
MASASASASASALAAAAPAIQESVSILMNRVISIVDPPKDIHVDSTLFSTANAVEKNRILDMIAGLFLKSSGLALANKHNLENFLNEEFKPRPIGHTFRPIKDQKELIYDYLKSKGIVREDLEYIPVLRLKHSSAHDPRLSGLYVSFDNAYKDVVSDPIFIITGGTLVDPSTRQTSGSNVKYVITHSTNNATDGEHIYNDLPRDYIRKLGMDTCINGNVTVQYRGNDNGWIVTVPTSFGGPIVGDFNDKCVPQMDEFKGNETKNIALSKLIKKKSYNPSDTIEGMKYILIKEIGDTFQVMWLKHIFDQEAASAAAAPPTFKVRYDPSNTVITSSDNVVLYRSIVNGIPVIHSEQDGTSKYYLPVMFSSDTKKKMIRDGIEKIVIETISHNKQVADTIAKVADEGKTIVEQSQSKGDPTSVWINGIEWKHSQIRNCALMLTAISFQIRIVNHMLYQWAEEQKASVEIYTELKDIKDLVSQLHSKSPFIKKNTETNYRTINSVTILLPVVGKINSHPVTCVAAKITPHNFTNSRKGSRGGTRENQERIFLDARKIKAEEDEKENQSEVQKADAEISAVSGEILEESALALAYRRELASQAVYFPVADSYVFTTEQPTNEKVHMKTEREDSYNIILGDYDAPDEWRNNVDAIPIKISNAREQARIDNVYPENADGQESDERGSPGLLHPKSKSPFLFFYVRAFHPEIFTYANCMNIGIQYGSGTKEIKDYELLLQNSRLLNEDDYQFSGNKQFTYYDGVVSDSKTNEENDGNVMKIYRPKRSTEIDSRILNAENQLRIDTVRAIKYTRYLIKAYPHLATKPLKSFLNQFSFIPYSHALKGHENPKVLDIGLAEESAAQLDESTVVQQEPQKGGGELTDKEIEMRLPTALQIAMDVYEIVYSLKIKANYLHIDYRDLIEDRLENIIHYNKLIGELEADKSPDRNLISMLHYERAVFYHDLESLPGGHELLQQHMHQLASETNVANVHENVGTAVESYGGRFRKTRRNRKVKKLKKAYTKSRRALKKQSRKNK